MARGEEKRRCSIYQLNVSSIEQASLKPKYLETDGFTEDFVDIAGVRCRLIVGHMETRRAKWADALAAATNSGIEVANMTAAALLLVPVEGAVLAVSYGMGHHLIDHDVVEPAFGLQYAVRVLDSEALKAVTQHTLDSRARIDRRSIPAGAGVLEFGMADLGIAVSRVMGHAKADNGKKVTVKGADSLNLSIRHDPKRLIEDLRDITVVLKREVEDADLKMLTRMSPLGLKDPRKKELNKRLNDALLDDRKGRLGTAWPWERADEFTVADSVTVLSPSGSERYDSLSIDDLRQIVIQSGTNDPLSLLKRHKVLLHADEDHGEVVSPAILATKWIAFETHISDTLFFYHDGRWLSMNRQYSDLVNEQCREVLNKTTELSFIPWQWSESKALRWDEETYNKEQASNRSGFLVMDRQLVTTTLHRRKGFEACDLLGPGGEFIHVKRLKKAADASHLFAQVLVSTEALKIDGVSMSRFREKVSKVHAVTAPDQVHTVVLAIAGRHPLQVDDLFTFSQVTLLRLVENLRARGVEVYVCSIADRVP